MARRPRTRKTLVQGVAAVLASTLVLPLTMSGASAQEEPPPPEEIDEVSALVFSKTAAFRHSSIEDGLQAIIELGDEHGFTVDHTEDGADFTAENLANYDAVIWLSTTGDVLDDEQQAAFEQYIEGGGGYAGVHAASDTEYGWPWYGGLVGAYFSQHPQNQTATVKVADSVHPSTSHLPDDWERYDEWYNFRTNPRGDVHVLATLDEDTYDAGGGAMGRDHPIAWCQYYNGGRSWYTGMGHTSESFEEPLFRQHLAGGIMWAAGVVENDCGGTNWLNYQKVVLDASTASPMGLDTTPDGRVIYIEREGQVKIIDPDTATTSTAGTIPVYTEQENGLLGVALDPDFEANGWVYFYYSPRDDVIDSPRQYLSRFTLEGDTLDLASEQILLEVPHQRDTCCHSGGYLQFGPDGELWIATGDDTSPSASDGFTPIDERPGREAYDAQRSSANTNDLRGKLLRIVPTDDGGYTIPEGNLFPEDADDAGLTLPEIYAMGFRNPFRFSVDERTGWAYLGDYGPDANQADPERGSDGRVEWNLIKEPGNYGWPYCHGGEPFNDFDFATNESGDPFDCDDLVNTSPNNTGLTQLPPNVEPDVWYGRGVGHPDIGRGGAPMGGPRYYFDEELDSDRKWPAYFDGTVLFYEWGQNDLYEFHLTQDGELHDITPLLPNIPVNRPHEMKFGAHDGALYMIEWGSGFGGNNPDSQIVRVDYTGGNPDPIAKVAATPVSGSVPLEVEFSSAGTAHPQGGELSYLWTFGDGGTSTEPNPTHTYTVEGNYTAILTVTDVQGRIGTANVRISAGNTAPTATFDWPVNGGIFTFDDEIPYEVTVTDPEDGTTDDGGIDCSDVRVQVILGHDDHGHPGAQFTGCGGTFVAERDDGHSDVDRITYVLEAAYTDRGSPDGAVAPMTGRGLTVMQPSRKQAEHHDAQDIRNEETRDPLGGDRNIGWLQDGAHARYSNFNFANIEAMRFRVASNNATSRIEVRKDGVNGELLGTASVPNTGGFQAWDWAEASVIDPGETFDLYLVFRGGSGYLLNLNFFDFVGEGVAGGPQEFVPVPSASIAPSEPDGAEGWYVSPTTLTLTGEDVDWVEYRIAQGEWITYEGPVTLPEGDYRVEYRAASGENVSRVAHQDVSVDLTAPTTSAELTGVVEDGSYTGAVTLEFSTDESGSGLAATQWRLAGGDTSSYTEPVLLAAGDVRTIEYRSVDVAGNVEEWQSVTFQSPAGVQPELRIDTPATGGVLPVGRAVPVSVSVVGNEDVNCADLSTRLILDTGSATYELDTMVGCEGTLLIELPDGLDANDLRGYTIESSYELDAGADVRSLVESDAAVTLQPHRKQAEHHDPDSGIRTEATGDVEGGGLNVGWIRSGFSMSYSDVNLSGIDSMRFRIASSSTGGTLELRSGSATGDLLGSVAITNTGGGQVYEWFESEVTDPGATVDLVLVFRADHSDYIANINFFEFVGDGVTVAAPEPVEVTPVAVTFSDEDGSYSVPSVEGVEYVVDGVVVSAGTHEGVGTVTVTARALVGFVLAEGAVAEWSFTFSTEPEPVEVTPVAVTFSDEDGSYSVPSVEGVEYVVDGVVVSAGTHEGVGTVTVTARALVGFVLAEGAVAEWSFTFSTEPEPEPDDRGAEFHLSNGWRGVTHVFFKYGWWADEILIGDWNGDGVDTVAVRRGSVFHVSNAQRGGDADVVFTYGRPDDVVLVGDWNGDGVDTLAVRRGADYHVKNSLRGGDADVVFTYGRESDQVLVGDWNGDGTDTFAVRRDAVYHVKNSLRGGDADVTFAYGRATDVTHVGDWDGNGTDTMAVQRGRTFHVNNSLRGGDADIVVTFGRLGDEVHVGDWDGDGTDTLGIRRPVGGHTTAAAAAGGSEVGSAI